MYTEPSHFDPDRYLRNPALLEKTLTTIFGYGRRSCAGKGLALDTAWMATVSMVAAFNISKAISVDGKEIDIEMKVQPGSARYECQLECNKLY